MISPQLGGPVSLDELKGYRDAGIDQVVVGIFAKSRDGYRQALEDTAEKLIVPLG